MKIIGITGSSRHGMNTGTLVEKILDGARQQGAEVEHLYLGDYHLLPCQACEACRATRRCVLPDDMQRFHDAINSAQALVLGTPIYFDHVSAQLKLFLDRLYPYSGPNGENYFPPMQAAFVATWGDHNPHLYDNVPAWLGDRLACYFKVEPVGTITAADTGATFTGDQEALLRAAFALGQALYGAVRK